MYRMHSPIRWWIMFWMKCGQAFTIVHKFTKMKFSSFLTGHTDNVVQLSFASVRFSWVDQQSQFQEITFNCWKFSSLITTETYVCLVLFSDGNLSIFKNSMRKYRFLLALSKGSTINNSVGQQLNQDYRQWPVKRKRAESSEQRWLAFTVLINSAELLVLLLLLSHFRSCFPSFFCHTNQLLPQMKFVTIDYPRRCWTISNKWNDSFQLSLAWPQQINGQHTHTHTSNPFIEYVQTNVHCFCHRNWF